MENCAECYQRYLTLKPIAINPTTTDSIQKSVITINVFKETMHIAKIARKFNIPQDAFLEKIKEVQAIARKTAFTELTQQNPVFAELTKLIIKKTKANHLEAKKIDKLVANLAEKIIKNKELMTKIELQLPKLAQTIITRSAQNKNRSLDD